MGRSWPADLGFHSQSYPEKYNEADQQKTWESFGRKRPDGSPQYTWGTVVYLAKQHGHKTEVNNQIDEINKRFFMIRNFGGKCVIGEMKKSDLGTGLSPCSANRRQLYTVVSE